MNHRRKLTLRTCFLAFFSRVIRYCSYRQHNPHRNKPPCYDKFTGPIALKVSLLSGKCRFHLEKTLFFVLFSHFFHPLKRALSGLGMGLQPLVVNDQTAAFPMQELDRGPLTVQKNEHVATQRVSPHLGTDHTGQGVKTLPHVGGTCAQVILQAVGQGEHRLTTS